jgi:CO/xanthine dehydrogenase Mo-binding subunit
VDTITTEFHNALNASAEYATDETLNVETVGSIPFLSDDHRWAIRFNSDETVTIVLGARDYGRGWFSGFFAGVAAARLGIPFQQFRIYYSANHPAALQTPLPYSSVRRRGNAGPFASAIVDIIEEMCDQVIAKGRTAFAATAGIGEADVGFDQTAGRFFVLDINRSSTVMDVATRGHGTRDAPRRATEGFRGSEVPEPTGYILGRCNE